MFKTACHSWSDRLSGNDMFAEDDADEPNKDPRKGIEGIDLMRVARVKGESAFCGACGRVALANV